MTTCDYIHISHHLAAEPCLKLVLRLRSLLSHLARQILALVDQKKVRDIHPVHLRKMCCFSE